MRKEITVAEFAELAKQRPQGLNDIFNEQDVFVDAEGRGWLVPEADLLYAFADAYLEGRPYGKLPLKAVGTASFVMLSAKPVSVVRWVEE